MNNLPTNIQDCILTLDHAWGEYKAASLAHGDIASHQANIIAAKNRLINCLTSEVL